MMPETLLAAALMHPEGNTYCERFRASKVDPDRFYQVLVANKIILRAVRQADLTESATGTIVRALMTKSPLLRSAHQLYREVDDELFRLVDLFELHNLDAIFIKPVSYLPIDSDNYDVLIRREDLTRAFTALKREGFVHLTRIVEPDKYLFREVKRTKTFVAVHLHTHIGWDGVRFLDPEVAWSKQRIMSLRGRKVRFLSFDHNLLVTFAHLYFENHQFRLSDLAYAVEDVFSHQVDWNYVSEAARTANWESAFIDTLRRIRQTYRVLFGMDLLEEQEAMKLPLTVRPASSPRSLDDASLPQDLPVTGVFYNLMRKIWRDSVPIQQKLGVSYQNVKLILQRRFNSQTYNKIVVSFSGPDMSGKTTHALLLCKSLGEKGITTRYLWTRGAPFVSDRVWNSMRDTLGVSKRRNKIWASNLRQARVAASYVYLINQFLKLKAGLFLARKTEVKVLDRTLRDTVVDVESEFAFTPSFWILKLLESGLPEPTIWFLMSPGTSAIRARVPERDRYLAALRDEKITCVDTDGDVEKNALKILSLVLTKYYGAEGSDENWQMMCDDSNVFAASRRRE